MMESSNSKKSLFYLIILILTLIAMIISTTIAYFSLIASQKKDDTVLYTGTLQVNYIDGTYIKNPTLTPLKEVKYDTYYNVYRNNFSVTSTGTLDQTIAIDLIMSVNEFEENAIKYSLYNSKGRELSNGIVPKEGTITLASNMFLSHGDTAQYTLLIWLDETGYNQNFEMGNTFSGKINIRAVQMKY